MIDVSQEDDAEVPIATTASVLVPIVNSSVKLYRSHPKPVAIPTYNTKKIGGAILISNPHVRLSPSVNGFILQSDISESAESPQSNNTCLQQALLNIK
nr:unnamed protein product [Callosobruchus chinensis]